MQKTLSKTGKEKKYLQKSPPKEQHRTHFND